jgi:hypothetical protein
VLAGSVDTLGSLGIKSLLMPDLRLDLHNERDKENRREEAEHARQYVYQWECRREGLAPLTIEELRRHGLRAQNQPAGALKFA